MKKLTLIVLMAALLQLVSCTKTDRGLNRRIQGKWRYITEIGTEIGYFVFTKKNGRSGTVKWAWYNIGNGAESEGGYEIKQHTIILGDGRTNWKINSISDTKIGITVSSGANAPSGYPSYHITLIK